MTLQSESLTNIVPALLKAKAEFEPARKNATNPHFGSAFINLEGVLDAVESALTKHNLLLIQPTEFEDGQTVLCSQILHASGEWIGSRYPVRPVKSDPQSEGSALTYARRYTAMALLGIAPEDDDGNAASRPRQTADEPPFDTSPYEQRIDAATTPDELKTVGAELNQLRMPADAHQRLVNAGLATQGGVGRRHGCVVPLCGRVGRRPVPHVPDRRPADRPGRAAAGHRGREGRCRVNGVGVCLDRKPRTCPRCDAPRKVWTLPGFGTRIKSSCNPLRCVPTRTLALAGGPRHVTFEPAPLDDRASRPTTLLGAR